MGNKKRKEMLPCMISHQNTATAGRRTLRASRRVYNPDPVSMRGLRRPPHF